MSRLTELLDAHGKAENKRGRYIHFDGKAGKALDDEIKIARDELIDYLYGDWREDVKGAG